MNLYQYVRGNPGILKDPSGAWTPGEHGEITPLAFDGVQFSPSLSGDALRFVRDELVSNNKGVDVWYLASMRWHYLSHYNANSDRQLQEDQEYDRLYWENILERRGRVVHYLSEAKKKGFWYGSNCKRALQIIGNIDHTYQDFFAHAKREACAGPTAFGDATKDAFLVWTGTAALTPKPDKRNGVSPSSYSYWHDKAAHASSTEPVRNTDERERRWKKAIEFQNEIYRSGEQWSIQAWWETCSCWVRKDHASN
jgi:hypothetical protein